MVVILIGVRWSHCGFNLHFPEYGFWKPIKSPTGLALIARTHSNRQRNILGQKLVKEAQCSLRLPGCIPEDGWLSTEDRWFRQATWQRFPGAPCPASYRWQMPSVPKATTEGNRKEAVQSRTFLCKESDTTEWLNWMCFSTGRSHINFNCLPGAIIVMRSGSCPLRNKPQEFPRVGKGWQLPSRNPVGYSSGGGQVSQMPCTKQHFSSQECKALSQMAHLFSNNF